ncbi:hypothetical protein [Winogradskyella sp. A2]|uniref:hypothetical protein n=1 Tax=Winogradskyella sp. A2 TaxID=3366944 RepID=UPI00398C52D6
MNTTKIIQPWIFYFKAFLIVLFSQFVFAQNTSIKKIEAENVEIISIDGNQLFMIEVMTSNLKEFKITSIVDGEYENNYQIISSLDENTLNIKLERVAFAEIEDDKRNAHKVIDAKLLLEIPKKMNLSIISDIASVQLDGNYNTISIQLRQGYCNLNGSSKTTSINTIDGNISVITEEADVRAISNKGSVNVYPYNLKTSIYNLRSINGDISVRRPD